MEEQNPISTSFRRGLSMLRVYQVPKAVEELKAAIGVKNRQAFEHYANGKVNLKVDKWNKVLAVFKSYGIDAPFGEFRGRLRSR